MKVSIFGSLLAAIVLLINTALFFALAQSWIIAAPLGLLISAIACRPVDGGDKWVWHKQIID